MSGRSAWPTAGCCLLALLLPAPAAARGIAGRADLPIPVWLFAVAAVAVLLVSFGLLRWFRRTPRERPVARPRRVPAPVRIVGGTVGFALLALVSYSGAEGTPTITANFAPTFVFVVFWIGLPVLSLLLGDVFTLLNPWAALARTGAWLARRAGRPPRPPRPYPLRLGRWPAALSLLVFGWLDVVFSRGSDPQLLAILVAAYAGVQLVGISVYGITAWSRNADGFSVLFSLFAELSTVELTRTTIAFRRPLSGLGGGPAAAGTTAVLCVVIGIVTFDGLNSATLWQRVEPDFTAFAFDRGAGLSLARDAGATIGLLMSLTAVSVAFALALVAMRSSPATFGELAGRFGPSLAPIAAAYLVAHYGSLLLYQGQTSIALLSDPLGDGSDLFGTATLSVDYGLLSAAAVWYGQVLVLVVGHVAALVAAHDQALRVFGSPQRAARSQLSMLSVMVAFTLLALFLLASINV